jgi:glycosyltransferase involved in cell wall biosynthesis
VFNRYLERGGEEKSVDRIYRHLADNFELERCFFDSAEWTGPDAPSTLGQIRRMFHNKDSARRLGESIDAFGPDALLFHNIYPVGSPSLYRLARERKIPVIQYAHNFRPFSVGGSLRAGGENREEALRGNYLPEILGGAWQNSRLKTLVFASVLKRMRARGDLGAVHCWIAISDFIRKKFIEAGLDQDTVHTLRHSWDAMESPPNRRDEPAYLMMCRLVEEKGVRVALAAWKRLASATGNDSGGDASGPELWIAGDGPLKSEVVEAAAANPRIRYFGFVDGDTKADLLTRCRAVLAPSVWFEPLGLVTYEAYDYQKPILAARSGGLEETVIDCKTGRLHDPGDVDGLCADVMRMEASSAQEREAMGRAGRTWLLENTGCEQWKQHFQEVWKSVCN